MVGYTTLEGAVVSRLLAHFSSELDEETCKKADIDSIFDAIFRKESKFGCVVDYDQGRPMQREPFKVPVWTWTIAGIFFIRYTDTVEEDIRMVIDKMITLFNDDHTMGKLTPLVELTLLGTPDPGAVNDVPFYFFPFMISIIDR